MRGLNDISLEAHRKTQFCFHQSRPKYSNNFFLLDFEFCDINLSTLKIYILKPVQSFYFQFNIAVFKKSNTWFMYVLWSLWVV